jgi:hypothetical protein
MKRFLVVACLAALTAAAAWAKDPQPPTAAGSAAAGSKMPAKQQMEAMKAEMMKCAGCKPLAMRFDEIAPMQMEAVHLDKGLAMLHSVEPAKLPAYRQVAAEMHKAGEACMAMTDAEAKAQLCELCQGMRSAIKAGAKMSVGQTKQGDIMVLVSEDPAVQSQLATLADKCAAMTGGPQATR